MFRSLQYHAKTYSIHFSTTTIDDDTRNCDMVLLFIHVPLTYPNTTVNAYVKIMLFQYYPDWFPYVCIENSILLAISTFLSIPTLDDQELTATYIKSNRQVTCDPLNNSKWKTNRV